MYDKQVTLFRYCAEADCTECAVAGCPGPQKFLQEAADVIEKLSQRVEDLEAMREISSEAEYAIDKHADNLISHMEELISGLKDKSHWISVTEGLPKENGWYQVYAPGYSGGSSSGLKNINGNMYSAFKHGKWSIEVGYHKRPGCVKAWMPLPEPPKEDK